MLNPLISYLPLHLLFIHLQQCWDKWGVSYVSSLIIYNSQIINPALTENLAMQSPTKGFFFIPMLNTLVYGFSDLK